ncbi:PREDICTED: uncharacterized protein LOC109585980 [Amphimedon queenslandica]|uniref:Right handed beta helix domain-containing protein n=1 Tax=Amphimedon queenslandica TaxID=400682 RepID=A0AAN0JLI1_AMPQE|nr:PREDICTED: uncharacterized protein LOC109585980 [Amphimedon queenslandica]|eukprot:XP_019857680.1 PREDICTED: uncharacterized protein LOC109585980 [Amphimedon queenslandica]
MLLALFLSALLASSCLSLKDSCQDLNKEFEDFHIDLLDTSVVRFVSLHENSTDSPPCLCRGNPCSSPRYALYGDPQSIFPVDNITVVLGSGIHRLNEGLTIINSSFISFIGVEGTILECGRDPIFDNCSLGNIFISDSSYISFSDITFQNCHEGVPMVHVKWSDHVIFSRCTFQNNPMSAVHLQQVDSVAFRECNFIENVHLDDTLIFDNHTSQCYLQRTLSDSFFFNTGPTAGAISLYADDQPFKLLVSGSTFNRNSVSGVHNNDTNIPNTLLQHGHGGAMYVRLVGTSNAEICIENSNFTANSAQVNGGAFQFSAAERSSQNEITIINSNFIDNNCTSDSCTGGAISIDYFQDSVSNSFIIIDSLFMDNRAGAGGALVLLTSVNSVSHEFSEHLVFRGCKFIHNFAQQDGSALSVFSVTPISSFPLPLAIQDCLFQNNTALNTNQKTAAVSGFRVDVSFLGTNVFNNNFGGGLSVIESQINVQNELVFHHNFATSGGALALYGRCLLKLYEDSNLTFYENFALRNGGGLYVEYVRTDFIFGILNRGCFIQYQSIMDLRPRDWNTTVNFISNTAGEAGSAIYASDMSYCRWYGDDVSTDTPIFVPYQGVRTPFYFRDNRIGLSDSSDNTSALSTDAFQMTAETEEDYDSYSYNEGVLFRLSALDRFNNTREAVWQVDAPLENEPLGAISSERTLYTYRIPSKRDLMETNENSTNISLTFSIFTISTSITPVERNISVDPCHPGYTFNERTSSCECAFNLRQIVRCDSYNRYFYVQEGLWVYTDGSDIVFRGAIPGFLNCTQERNLPGCLFKFDEPNEQCATGRTGDLCAHCAEGYNLALDLLRCRKNCSDVGAAFLFVGVCKY